MLSADSFAKLTSLGFPVEELLADVVADERCYLHRPGCHAAAGAVTTFDLKSSELDSDVPVWEFCLTCELKRDSLWAVSKLLDDAQAALLGPDADLQDALAGRGMACHPIMGVPAWMSHLSSAAEDTLWQSVVQARMRSVMTEHLPQFLPHLDGAFSQLRARFDTVRLDLLGRLWDELEVQDQPRRLVLVRNARRLGRPRAVAFPEGQRERDRVHVLRALYASPMLQPFPFRDLVAEVPDPRARGWLLTGDVPLVQDLGPAVATTSETWRAFEAIWQRGSTAVTAREAFDTALTVTA